MDRQTRRKVLKKIPYGLYVLSAATPQRSAAVLVNWIMQVSFEPPLLAVALESDSEMCHLVTATGLFAVNMLPTGATSRARTILRSKTDKKRSLSLEDFEVPSQGPPVLRAASDVLICRVVSCSRTGDHMLFIAEVVEGTSHSAAPVLTLHESGLSYSR